MAWPPASAPTPLRATTRAIPFSSAPSFDNTGYRGFSAQAATTGGDNNGFELNPTYASGDGPLYASNIDGPGDRHLFYNYGLAPPSGSTIEGIRVRLDWWLDAVDGDNSMSVELSWDGGTNWTSAKTDTVESTTEHTGIVGGAGDTWGRIWTVAELANANFRVRLTCTCSGSARMRQPRLLPGLGGCQRLLHSTVVVANVAWHR